MLIEPVLIELLRGFVTQGQVRPHLLVDLVPGEESSLEPADTSGQIFYLIELLFIGVEGALYLAIGLWVIRAIEVVG